MLAPAAAAYAGVVAARNALYDRDALSSRRAAIPVLSLGNVTVGGTGKTPIAAWVAARLRTMGARPAIVLRGYGGDESLVHARLNPAVVVVVDPDRVRGVARATELGADCAILDDAFQHRRIRRNADWVLVAAEHWREGLRLLPVGPLREPFTALRRADALIVTRKTATREHADMVVARLERYVGADATALFHLAPHELVHVLTGERQPLGGLAGRRIVAPAAVGAPDAFFDQLRRLDADVHAISYRDHHAYDAGDVAHLIRSSEGADGVVCTLKDAVKLGPIWPPTGPPLWYVSQRTVVERGALALDSSLHGISSARTNAS